MEKAFNLAEQVAIARIESILDDYPNYPYHKAFAIPSLRQELIDYVLNHLIEDYNGKSEPVSLLNYSSSGLTLGQQRYLETLTHQGIYSLLRSNRNGNSLFTWLKRFNRLWNHPSKFHLEC